jgi:hypothetical protein
MGGAGRERAIRRFGLRLCIDRYDALYRRITRRSPAAARIER